MFIGPGAKNNTRPFNHFSQERLVEKKPLKKRRTRRRKAVDFHSTSLTDRNPNGKQQIIGLENRDLLE